MTETVEGRAGIDLEDLPEKALVAEQAVAGAAAWSPGDAVEALALLRPEHFRVGAHRHVMEAVERLVDSGVKVKEVTDWSRAVLAELAKTGMLDRVGAPGMGYGGPFLHSLIQRAGNVAYHAEIVIGAARQRQIMSALRSAASFTKQPWFDPAEHAEQVRQMVEDACGWSEASVLRPNSETVNEVLAAVEAGGDPGISTGFPDLDDAIGGLRNSELIVIGARPGVGKSLSALQFADNIGTDQGLPVLFASAEMTEEELTMRRIAARARVPLSHLVRGTVTDPEWDKINAAHGKLTDTSLYIDDTPSPSLGHIRGRLRALYRQGVHVRLLVIDYLGFLQAPKAESRQQAVSELARGAKRLAQEFEIPVILLSQLNRGPEHRSDKVPTMADLRESGEIEQTANIIILLHREDVYDKESKRAGEIDLIIAKNRQGPTCTVTLCHQAHYGRIVSMSSAWSPSSVAERAA